MFMPGILQLPLAIAVLVDKVKAFFSLPPSQEESNTTAEIVSAKPNEQTEPEQSLEQSEDVNYKLFQLIRNREWTPDLADQLKTLVVAGADINFRNPIEFNHPPLVHALLHSRFDWIVSLLANGADVAKADRILINHYNRTASDFAWEKRNMEVARQLVQADGAFPDEFGSEFSFVDKILEGRLKMYVKSGEKLHKNIERNYFQKIEKFVTKNPKVKVVYNCRNQCALTTALKQRNFEMYSFLRSRGFTHGIDSYNDETMRSLKASNVRELKTCLKRYFKTASQYVLELLSKSSVQLNNDDEDISTVRRYFEALDDVKEVQPILKFIASQANVSIVFNFDRNPVEGWNQPRNPGIIAISANEEIEAKNLEIVVRELTWYVLLLMYDNLGLPYGTNEDKPRKLFEKAAESFRESFSENNFAEALNFERNVPLELIIPQIMTLHVRCPEQFAEIRELSKEVSEFYDNWVLPELTNEISSIEPRKKVQELNELLAVFHRLKSTKLNCVSHKREFKQIFTGRDHILACSPTPEMVLTSFIRNSNGNNEIDSTHIFVAIEQLMDSKIFEMIHEALQSELQLTLVLLDSNDVDIDIVAQLLNSLLEVAMKIVFATSRQHLKLQEWIQKSFDIHFKYKDLDERSKDVVLKANINFQGAEVALNEILDCTSDFLQEFPLENVTTLGSSNSTIEFKETLPPVSEIFVERQFETSANSLRTSENVIGLVESGDTVVVQGVAGMGKTTSAVHFAKALKQKNKLSWVAFVDWKQLSESFKENQEDDAEFISAKLLHLKIPFWQKLFINFYDRAKVIFVVDDITNESAAFKVLKTIQASGNHLLVTTSAHSASEIEEELATESIKLTPFTEDSQIDFFAQFWKMTWKKPYSTDFEEKARWFLDKTRKLSIENKILEVPLHLSMLVELIGGGDLNNLSCHSLYAQFINKQMKAALNDGIRVKENFAADLSAGYKFHQKVAIDEYLGRSTASALKLQEIINAEDFLSAGLLKRNKEGKLQFTHQSYAEYFIAELFFERAMVADFAEPAVEMFLQVLLNEKFKKTRDFVNDKLQTENKHFYIEAFEQKLEKSLKETQNQGFLHFLIKEQNANLLTFILQTLNLSASTKLELLKRRNCWGNEALHSALETAGIFKLLWGCIGKLFVGSDQKTLLMATGQHGRDVLNQALRRNENVQEPKLRRSNAFLRTLSQKIEERKQDILKLADRSDVRETVKLILNISTRLFEPEEFLEMLLAVDDYGDLTIDFIFESRSIETVNEVLDQISAKLDEIQIEKLLSQKSAKGQTILHRLCNNRSASTASALWDYVSKNLNQETVASLLFSKAGWEGNVFNLAACSNHPILRDLLEWLKRSSSEDIQKVFFTRNRDSWTFLHFVTWRCSESLVSKVFEVISEIFAGEDIKRLLLAEDRNAVNPQKRSLSNKCRLTPELVAEVYAKVLPAASNP